MLHALTGAVVALVSSYFVAVLFAYAFRIPVPFAGYYGPFGQIGTYGMSAAEVLKAVLAAWVFYGVFGGFIVLPALGAVTGILAGRRQSHSGRKYRNIALCSVLAGSVPVFALSILDYVIGPW